MSIQSMSHDAPKRSTTQKSGSAKIFLVSPSERQKAPKMDYQPEDTDTWVTANLVEMTLITLRQLAGFEKDETSQETLRRLVAERLHGSFDGDWFAGVLSRALRANLKPIPKLRLDAKAPEDRKADLVYNHRLLAEQQFHWSKYSQLLDQIRTLLESKIETHTPPRLIAVVNSAIAYRLAQTFPLHQVYEAFAKRYRPRSSGRARAAKSRGRPESESRSG